MNEKFEENTDSQIRVEVLRQLQKTVEDQTRTLTTQTGHITAMGIEVGRLATKVEEVNESVMRLKSWTEVHDEKHKVRNGVTQTTRTYGGASIAQWISTMILILSFVGGCLWVVMQNRSNNQILFSRFEQMENYNKLLFERVRKSEVDDKN